MLVSSCVKDDTSEVSSYITFGVTGIGSPTKSLLTNETLNSASTEVVVYGVRNNSEQIFNEVTIRKQADSYNWEPINSYQKKTWQSGSYSFYGYTCSKGNSTCTIDKEGLRISVTQPETYSESDMVDYMLSHAYKVADGNLNHIVMLYMQHAMACAEIVVKKQIPEHDVVMKSIELTGFYLSAIMECEGQANVNSGADNVWKTQISGSNNYTYSKNFAPSESQDGILGTMTLLAVPQQLSESTKLSVVYSVDEDNNPDTAPNEYTEEFDLFDYRPYVWESGNKIRYTLTINTGVELNAQIVDWINAGYIEGVILPQNQ